MKKDKVIFDLIEKEKERQQNGIELIASENFASPQVMKAMGTVLTNKYAEGLPGKRYYGGCEVVDEIEQLAIDRAKELFGAEWANVQPHSGSQANAAVYMALLKPGETVLGMSLADGGHLTHGASVSFSGRIYNAIQYGLDSDSGEIDYAQVEALALEHRPKMIMAGFSAYSRVIDWQRFRDIADKVGAYFVVDMEAPGVDVRPLRQMTGDAEFNGKGVSPMGPTVYAFSGEGKLNRKDWGMEWNAALEAGGMLVSDEVKIEVEVEATPAE